MRDSDRAAHYAVLLTRAGDRWLDVVPVDAEVESDTGVVRLGGERIVRPRNPARDRRWRRVVPAVSDRGLEFLAILQFRASLGTSYLVGAGRGRVALVVPTMSSSRSLARLDAYMPETVDALAAAELITSGDPVDGLRYAGRRNLDRQHGRPVELTLAGWAHPTSANRGIAPGELLKAPVITPAVAAAAGAR